MFGEIFEIEKILQIYKENLGGAILKVPPFCARWSDFANFLILFTSGKLYTLSR